MKAELTFFIDGMTCAACSGRVQKALLAAGCTEASVSLANKKASVSFDTEKLTKTAIFLCVEHAGFTAREEKLSAAQIKRRARTEKIRLFIAALFSAVLLYAAMAAMIKLPGIIDPGAYPAAFVALQIGLVSPVLICGYKFYTRGFLNLIKRRPNMDSLVAVGTSAALGYSIFAAVMVFLGNTHYVHSLYFESAAVIIALILLGKFLEARALKKTGSAIEKLMSVTPETAVLLVGGKEKEVSVADIKKGDLLVIRQGMAAAVDGEVTGGEGCAGEAMLTGEPLPAYKSAGCKVYAGTALTEGYLTYRAEKVGRETMVSSIVMAVERAQSGKAKAERAADKIAGIFTPAVMLIALLTFIIRIAVTRDAEQSLTAAIAVLTVSCPCALGLATPVAAIAATGRAAEAGVLFKNADALTHIAAAKVVAFDKTGTLTHGNPAITKIEPMGGFSPQEVLAYAAAAEAGSVHPVAAAIRRRAQEDGLSVPVSEHFHGEAGKGVYASVAGKKVYVGKVPQEAAESLRGSYAYTEIDGVPAGIIHFEDEIRDSSPRVIAELKSLKIEPVMITGDNAAAAEAVGRAVGITEIYAGILPGGKAETVKDLKARGKVLFVGDGINDAPALSEGDAGIAVAGSADIAKSGADAVLTADGIAGVSFSIKLSRKAARIIKENLGWAFIYNAVCIPLAAAGIMSPMLAALAMSLSSISVLLNALRLTFYKKRNKTAA